MKKKYLFFLLLLLALVFIFKYNNVEAQVFSKKALWSQEFSSLGKRPLKNWNQTTRFAPSGEAFFTDSIGNVFISRGFLHLKATADKRGDKVCSSGYVSTKGLKSFLYGKLEIRAKVPTGKGIFPAIWMLREDHGTVWPLGEIDIMEYIDCFNQEEFATTIHILNRENGEKGNPTTYKHGLLKKTDMTKFHIFGLEWTKDALTLTLDFKPYYTLKKEDAEYWPFDAPYILILDVEFGSWGAKCGKDESIFPREMLIDWIRYYPLIE